MLSIYINAIPLLSSIQDYIKNNITPKESNTVLRQSALAEFFIPSTDQHRYGVREVMASRRPPQGHEDSCYHTTSTTRSNIAGEVAIASSFF